MNLPALVLAAGASTRLGFPKQAVRVEGEPLLRRTARMALAAGFDPVTVVLGAARTSLAPLLDGLPLRILDNPHWAEGMASSLRVGVANLPPEAEGLLVLVCDQVRLDPSVLGELREAFHRNPQRPAACVYGGRRGVPAIFPNSAFGALAALKGDGGARALLREGAVSEVPWPEGKMDLDVPRDMELI